MEMLRLAKKEAELLQFAGSKFPQSISLMIDAPNMRVINSLVRKGMLQDIMGVFWKITPEGVRRLSLVENRQPLPAGTVIEFSGIEATVVSDEGGIGPLRVKQESGRSHRWWWESGGHICTVVRMSSNSDDQAN